jgi:hypothetical protein
MTTQIKFVTPNGDRTAIDNSAAPAFPSVNAGTLQGYDTTAPGATAQGTNPFGDRSGPLLDGQPSRIVKPR